MPKIDAVVYDIEIEAAIPDKFEPPDPDFTYCAGWHDYANMGISVIGAYDYRTDRYRVFCQDNLDAFFDLCTPNTLLVGFNNVNFDNKVIATLKNDHQKAEIFEKFGLFYDILREVWAARGLGPEFNPKTHGGYSLDALAKANGVGKKSDNGANAAIAWQAGHVGTVVDYCLHDVALTKRLFDLICCDAALCDPRNPAHMLKLNPPPLDNLSD